MTEEPTYQWEQAYVTAILETDNTKLQERIDSANAGILARVKELKMDHGGTPEERLALENAIRGLNLLKKERLGDTSGGGL